MLPRWKEREGLRVTILTGDDLSHLGRLLTSSVCAFRTASLGRGLERSFTRIWWIRLHVRLLIVMVRIRENPVLLYCPAGHHFHRGLWVMYLACVYSFAQRCYWKTVSLYR